MSDDRDPALAAAEDELADAPLEEFVKTRDRLARALKADGHAEAAATLRARRRPSLVAWSVNRAARDRPELVAALFAAADDVRDAVERGDGDALRTAMRAQRTRLSELTDVAVDRARTASPNPRAHTEAIARTFEAAAGDVALRDAVTRGELVGELRPGDAVQGTPVTGATAASATATGAARSRLPRQRTAGTEARPARHGGPAPRPRDELALRRAEDDVAAARAALAEARRAARESDKEAERAARAAKRAHDEEDRARRRLERAEAALAERRSR